MISLKYSLLKGPFSLNYGQTFYMCIENTLAYRNLIQDILGDWEDFGLFEGEKEVKAKDVALVDQVFLLDMNERTILNRVYKELEALMEDEFNYLRTRELEAYLQKEIEDLIHESDLPLEITEDLHLVNFLKAMNIQVREDGESFVEKIIDYINISIKLLGKKIFIFINLSQFLIEEELEIIRDHINQQQVLLVSIESYYSGKTNLEGAKNLVIDGDFSRLI